MDDCLPELLANWLASGHAQMRAFAMKKGVSE
jgi:hypothetical protein